MNATTAQLLCKLNSDFYRNNAASFAATRHSPWPGWQRCLDSIKADCAQLDTPRMSAAGIDKADTTKQYSTGEKPAAHSTATKLSKASKPSTSAAINKLVLCDIACGNLRFEAFLADALPSMDISCYALDNCSELVAENLSALASQSHSKAKSSKTAGSVSGDDPTEFASSRTAGSASSDDATEFASHITTAQAADNSKAAEPPKLHIEFQELDIVELLVNEQDINSHLQAPKSDLAVAFGFLHHIPGARRREAFLQSLIQQLRPGGYAIVSLWQFLQDPGLKKKSEAAHRQALLDPRLAALDPSQLEPGDCLIAWNNAPGQYRYCHSFSAADIGQLKSSVAAYASLVSCFQSDGRSNKLNSYLIFKALE